MIAIPACSKNAQTQSFCLPKPIMIYICKNMKSKYLEKLYKSCKCFFPLIELKKIENLCLVGKRSCLCATKERKLQLSETPELLNNGILFGTFCISSNKPFPLNLIIDKIAKCFLNSLRIYELEGRKLTYEELKLLMESKTLNHIILSDAVNYSDGSPVPFEEILYFLPKASIITIDFPHITPETGEKIMLLKREKKILRFQLIEANNPIGTKCLCHFIKENFIFLETYFLISHQQLLPENYIIEFNQKICDWKKIGEPINGGAEKKTLRIFGDEMQVYL